MSSIYIFCVTLSLEEEGKDHCKKIWEAEKMVAGG